MNHCETHLVSSTFMISYGEANCDACCLVESHFTRAEKLLFLVTGRLFDLRSIGFMLICFGDESCDLKDNESCMHPGKSVFGCYDLDCSLWVGDEFFGITDAREYIPPGQGTPEEILEALQYFG